MNLSQPIGIFDSGIGGLTIVKNIKKLIPNEQIIYFGDIKYMPYGNKSKYFIEDRTKSIINFFIKKNCKSIIIACNSITSNTFYIIKNIIPNNIKIFNVIDPIIDKKLYNNYKKIGIIATSVTVKSNIYRKKLQKIIPNLEIVQIATPLLALIIEKGIYKNNKILNKILNFYLKNNKLENIDALILACTHYHIIDNEIKKFFNHKIYLLDITNIIAYKIYKHLKYFNFLSKKKSKKIDIFYASILTKNFIDNVKFFCGEKNKIMHLNII